VIVGCLALLAVGLVLAAWWGRLAVESPAVPRISSGSRRPVSWVAGRYLWWATVCTVAGLTAGLLAAGAGGRLVMRLLAHTSPDSRGFVTEANQVVGHISVDGSLGFLFFSALPIGLVTAAIYLVIRRLLPCGYWRGLAFGALLLLLVSIRVEPLRPDNPDFSILGPGWLAAVAFGALALLHGVLVAAVAGAFSRMLPHPRRGLGGAWLWYSPLILLFPLLPAVLALGLLVVAVSRVLPPLGAPTRRVVAIGRIALAAAALVALPGFVLGIRDLLI
jgi:hypothetical protein